MPSPIFALYLLPAMRPIILPRAAIRHVSVLRTRMQQTAHLSQRKLLSSSAPYNSPKLAPEMPNQNPQLPPFRFKDLGASRTVKVVVITCISVLATLESYFWMRVIWEKFGPAEEDIEAKKD